MSTPAGFKNGEVEYFIINSKGNFMVNGVKFTYDKAPRAIKNLFYNEYSRDIREVPERLVILKSIAKGEEFDTWLNCNFGGFNSTPDVDLKSGKITREFWDCGLKDSCMGYGVVCHNQFNLTRTEYVVLKTFKEGLPEKLVSSQLHISKNTLRNHNQSIMRKFNVHNKIEVLKVAEMEGVIL